MDGRKLVGWNVRKLRVASKVTLEELAERAGTEPSYLARLERGQANAGIDLLQRLVRALGAKLRDLTVELAPGEKPPKPLPAGRRPAKRAVRSRPPKPPMSLKQRDPATYSLLRQTIRKIARDVGKGDLVADTQSLDHLTARIAKTLEREGEPIREDILLSEEFRQTFAKTFGVTLADEPSAQKVVSSARGKPRRSAKPSPTS